MKYFFILLSSLILLTGPLGCSDSETPPGHLSSESVPAEPTPESKPDVHLTESAPEDLSGTNVAPPK